MRSLLEMRRPARWRSILTIIGFTSVGLSMTAQQKPASTRRVAAGEILTLEAKQQRQEGKMYYADGDVEVVYGEMRLHADHLEGNTETHQVTLRGHIRFDYRTQHLEATEGWYNLTSGRGSFQNVHGAMRSPRRPNPSLLVTPNPLVFEARQIERISEDTYIVYHAWLTVCRPDRPKWKFYTAKAVIKLDRSVHMVHASFRLFSVPVIYLPYASAPVGRHVRQSGFLIPDAGHSSHKGFILGDSYYWAPTDWMDMTLGAQWFSKRGWSQIGELRARPWENVRIEASYFGVNDRGLPGEEGVRVPQGGYESHQAIDAFLPGGWRAVADVNQLSSLTFRLAFAPNFAQAVNPEVNTTAFLTNNFDGFSLNFAAQNYKNFVNLSPAQAVVLRRAPEARLSSVDRPIWKRWPIYFAFDVFAGGVHREQTAPPVLETGEAVQRAEAAPSVTVPLRWGPWIGVTPTVVVRGSYYGEQQLPNGSILPLSLRRTTEELTLDLRPPSFSRIFERPNSRWKHAIEPLVVYRYVNGVTDFSRFIRFDENETITETNELEYSVTQRLFRRSGDDSAQELASWRISQKYYFDPTFGGAIVPGERNVFQALNSLTAFAFADGPRRFSPIVSDLRITPGGPYDLQFRVDYDPIRSKASVIGTLLKIRPYRQAFLTLAHFAVKSDTILQPRANQIRALVGYGDINRRGWNATFGISYDALQRFFQNQIAQVSYNGSCCGIALEYRRIALGPVRTENQFRVALLIANIGTFGNLRRQEKIF